VSEAARGFKRQQGEISSKGSDVKKGEGKRQGVEVAGTRVRKTEAVSQKRAVLRGRRDRKQLSNTGTKMETAQTNRSGLARDPEKEEKVGRKIEFGQRRTRTSKKGGHDLYNQSERGLESRRKGMH